MYDFGEESDDGEIEQQPLVFKWKKKKTKAMKDRNQEGTPLDDPHRKNKLPLKTQTPQTPAQRTNLKRNATLC